MIVDTSAVVAILRRKPDCERPLERIDEAETVGIGSPALVESGVVLVGRLGVVGRTLLARFDQEIGIDVEPFTARPLSSVQVVSY